MQIKKRDKIQAVHTLKNEGYNSTQIAEQMGISGRTVRRMLNMSPECVCVDGTQIRKVHSQFDPYKAQIQKLIECGFTTSQIMIKLQEMFPGLCVKRRTLNSYCVKLRTDLFEYSESPADHVSAVVDDSILSPFFDRIKQMRDDGNLITTIFTTITAEGYTGSYSLLQQCCHRINPIISRKKKLVRKVKRRDLVMAVWSLEKSDLTEKDITYIETNHPDLVEIKSIVAAFRTAYSGKDIEAVKLWCATYAQCRFPAICSFINGINADVDAFYNSMKYTYNNGLLEGSVNKLKAVKRSMYGRASYALLRAKLLVPQ